jgi:hypothetical protein
MNFVLQPWQLLLAVLAAARHGTDMDEYVATIQFSDGVWHPVYEEGDGRQYVIDDDGEKVYGVWFIPPGEPSPTVIVNAPAQR